MFQWFKKAARDSEPKREPEFRRAVLPPRKDEAEIPVSVSRIHDQDISQAVALFRANPNTEILDLYRQLIDKGMQRVTAARLVEFLPLVYGRLFLSQAGVQLSNEFLRVLPDGKLSSKRRLLEEPLWLASAQFAREERDRGASGDDLRLLANRSAEMAAATQARKNGSDLFFCSPPVFCWPEEGPDEPSGQSEGSRLEL